MEYACDKCNYETCDISNWKRHLETKKHRTLMIILDQEHTKKSSETSRKIQDIPQIMTFNDEKSIICNEEKSKSAVSTKPNKIFKKVTKANQIQKVTKATILSHDVLFNSDKKKSDFIICKYCKTSFTNKSNLKRHELNRCAIKREFDEYEKKIKEECEKKIREEYEKLDLMRQLNEKNQQIAKLTEDNVYFKAAGQASSATLNTSMTTINNSVNALTYLTSHFKKTPELKKLTQDNAKQMLMYEKRLYDYLLFSNAEKKLDQYVGDIILKHIQKDDPENQAVWNSDVSRLTYLVRKLVGDQHIWERDAKGEIFSKYVITPITDYLEKYLNECLNTEMLKPIETLFDQDEKMRKQGSILDTLRTIKKKKFKRAILLHIAPHVSFKIKLT